MKEDYLKELEQGAASIRIELKGGFLYVSTLGGDLLHKRLARRGDWASLWAELSKADRHNGVNVLGVREVSKRTLLTEALFLVGLFSFWYLILQIFA